MEAEGESPPAADPLWIEFQAKVSEFLPLLQELAAIHKSEQATGGLFAVIRTSILADVNSIVENAMKAQTQRVKTEQAALVSVLDQKINDGFAGVTSTTNQLQQLIFDLQVAKNATERGMGAVTDTLTQITTDISKVKSELRLKAEAMSLNDVIEQLASYTPLRLTEKLEAKLRNFPTYEDFSRLGDRLSDLSTSILDYAKLTEVRGGFRDCKVMIQDAMRDFVSQDSLSKTKTMLETRSGEIERAVDRVRRMVELQEESTNSAFQALNAKVNEKPWMADIDLVAADVAQRALTVDLETLRKAHEELESDHHLTEVEFRGDMEAFDSVLQRFDEVILLKASREDIKALTIQVNDPAPVVAVHRRVTELEEKLTACETRVSREKDVTNEIAQQVEGLIAANRAEDLSSIKERLHDLKEALSCKVERDELLLLKEKKADREDSDVLHTNLRLQHKQLEQVNVLISATLRTLLKDSDSRNQKLQQREYLLKLSETLGNWVAGFDPGTYHDPLERKDLWSPKDALRNTQHFSTVPSPRGEVSSRMRSPREAPRLPLLATSRLHTKHGRVHSQATHAGVNWPFDLSKV